MIVNMSALTCPLPAHILKELEAGNTHDALQAIDFLLKDPDTLPLLQKRLLIEKERMKRLPSSYPHNEETALQMLKTLDPSYTLEDLKALCRQGLIDWQYINGEPWYFVRFLRSLIKNYGKYAEKAGAPLNPHHPFLDPIIDEIEKKGVIRYQIKIAATLTIDDHAFLPKENYTIHLPIPSESAQSSDIHCLFHHMQPTSIAPVSHGQRTACYQLFLEKNQPFSWEYSYIHQIQQVDFSSPPQTPLYNTPKPTSKDLSQELPHIHFTPLLKELAKNLAGEETDPVKIARAFYDFITTKINYTFLPEYFFIDDIVQYTAVNRKGDCGFQALLFITLCRIAGIPARWQSGLSFTDSQYVGAHDWAQFYVEPWGWLFCDCSYGGSAFRSGNQKRWNFYFGHVDPFRMVSNHQFQGDFFIEKKHWRVDPYDNQYGECECTTKGFEGSEFDTDFTLLEYQKL